MNLRIIYNIGLAAAAVLLLTGCFSHIYDVTFLYDNDAVIVPSEGGTYFFEVEAGKRTKTSFEDRLLSFEYRINIDGNVIDRQIVNISSFNMHIHEGDVFKVDFVVPANESDGQRDIIVETLKAKDNNYWQYHVDADDEEWQVVWRATQSGVH